jgi:hypothetical protein
MPVFLPLPHGQRRDTHAKEQRKDIGGPDLPHRKFACPGQHVRVGVPTEGEPQTGENSGRFGTLPANQLRNGFGDEGEREADDRDNRDHNREDLSQYLVHREPPPPGLCSAASDGATSKSVPSFVGHSASNSARSINCCWESR